jgi:dipeptidase E
MKFALFSYGITQKTADKLSDFIGKTPAQSKILFITTPTNTYEKKPDWMLKSIKQFKSFGFEVERFDLEEAFNKGIDIKAKVAESDAVYVSGGNTYYFLYWAEKTQLKSILENFLQNGGVYSGSSAGVVCQIKDLTPVAWLDEPEKAPKVVKEGMQLTSLVVIPHWKNPKYHQTLKKMKEYYIDRGIKTFEIEDGEALFINGDEVEKVS